MISSKVISLQAGSWDKLGDCEEVDERKTDEMWVWSEPRDLDMGTDEAALGSRASVTGLMTLMTFVRGLSSCGTATDLYSPSSARRSSLSA